MDNRRASFKARLRSDLEGDNAWLRASLAKIRDHPRLFSSYDLMADAELTAFIQNYVRTYEGRNGFLRDLQRRLLFGECNLTIHQLRGATNFLQRELQRKRPPK